MGKLLPLKTSFLLRTLPLLLIIMLFSTCSREKTRERMRVVVAMEGAPSTIYPPLALSAYSHRAVELIHRGLFLVDETLSPKPDIAEKVEMEYYYHHPGDENADKKKYPDRSTKYVKLILHIREGQKTCSGKEITSDMVSHSIREYMKYGRFQYIKEIRELGKYRIEIKMRPYASVFYDLSVPVFPEEFTDCTGKFMVKEFVPKEKIVLLSRDGSLEVVIKGIKNDITRILEFEKGDVDILVNAIPPYLLQYAEGIEGARIIKLPGVNITYLALNTKNPFLKHRKVRKAIFHAIDREKVLREVMKGTGEVINSMLPKNSEFYCDCAEHVFSPEKAERLLDSAGFPRKENGKRFTLVWKTSTVKYALRNVKAIASYLERVGIEIKIVQREFTTFFYDIRQGNFDIYSLNFVGVKDPELLRYISSSDMFPPRGANRVFFSDPELDEILRMASEEFRKEERKKLYREAQRKLMEELPYIPLWQVKDIIAFNTREIDKEETEEMRFTPGGSLLFLSYMITNKKPKEQENQERKSKGDKEGRIKVRLERFLARKFQKPVFMVQNPVRPNLFYIVEQIGRIFVCEVGKEDGEKKEEEEEEKKKQNCSVFLDIRDRVDFGGEKGLLGMAFSPYFERDGKVFVSYTNKAGYSIISFFVSPDRARNIRKKTEKVILRVKQPFPNHNGGTILFGPDNLLYIGLGDGGWAGDPLDHAQNTKTLLGTILRINPFGEYIPKDNPFSGDVVCSRRGKKKRKEPKRGCAELFAWGLRNPWRFSFDRKTGVMWAGDVGQAKWEEIDIIKKGGNYGWRCYEGFEEYNMKGCEGKTFVFPITVYPIHRREECAVIGGYVYRGEKIKWLYGKYIFGDYCSGKIWYIDADKISKGKNFHPIPRAKAKELIDTPFMISSFSEDIEGKIYIIDHKEGYIYRMVGE